MKRFALLGDILAQHVETWIPRCQAKGVPNGVELVHGSSQLTVDLVKLQTRWEEVLDKAHVLDFATIQKRFLERQHLVEDQFRHIFVDEFQDSNPIQFAIHTAWLKAENTRLTVVGDDDQALYRFRGSDIECFTGLEPECQALGVGYRREALEINYRSTKAIVNFCQAFKTNTVLATEAMPKTVLPASKAPKGKPVRLLEGPWDDLCQVTASELKTLGVGKPGATETAAVLMFSTSERETRNHIQPALPMRRLLENEGIRTYNPTNKTAGVFSSPVAMLLGLISYLVDPVTKKKIPSSTQAVQVCASDRDLEKTKAALSVPVLKFVNNHHIKCQKHFFTDDGGAIGVPTSSRAPLIALLDKIRDDLAMPGAKPRLSLSGLVARLLADPLFRHSGFTVHMFRQAHFTQLLEASTAPTRLTMTPLDAPLEVKMTNGKYEWSKQFWDFLHYFGGYLESTTLDDEEVEAFEEDAVLIMTFHQAKGLEFDHVYVAGLGRASAIGPALRTRLFSGEKASFKVVDDKPETKDKKTLNMATADREREVYVALSRAKKTLTVLQEAGSSSPFTQPNEGVQKAFQGSTPSAHAKVASVKVRKIP